MTDVFAAVNGQKTTRFRLTVGNQGPWYVDATVESEAVISGQAKIAVGDLSLTGTVAQTGVYGDKCSLRIVAGANGWSNLLPAKDYHNDAGVKALSVAQDAARESGETLGGFVPASERLTADYVRSRGTGARVLEDVLGGSPWWVDFAGVTQAGPRPSVALDASEYLVLAFDPRQQIATVTADDPTQIKIGTTLVEGLDQPRVVRTYELVVDDENGMRFQCWVGGGETSLANLPGILKSIVQRSMDGRLYGKYRYRVVSVSGDRLQLQAVRKNAGVPDLLPVSIWPGVAGMRVTPANSTEVLVEFIEGDRTLPVVTQFSGVDGAEFTPTALVIGGPTGAPAARQGDSVEVLLPPGMFTGTVNGLPATGIIEFAIPKAEGVITAGSAKVSIA